MLLVILIKFPCVKRFYQVWYDWLHHYTFLWVLTIYWRRFT